MISSRPSNATRLLSDVGLELADMRYKNGVDSYLNVLTAQTDLYDAQLTLVTTRLQRLTNLVDLYRSLGGGWIQRSGEEPRPVTG